MSFSSPVLVTGATGFIGRNLVNRLLREGAPVRAFVLPDEPTDGLWDGPVDVARGDITNAQSVTLAMQGCGTVIHLAAVVGDWAPWSLFESVTIAGTKHVLEAALENNARTVVASSVVYYGADIGKNICSEERGPGKPLGHYSRSKQAQERLAREFMERGADVVIVRPTNVYGAGSRPWVDQTIAVLEKGDPSLIGGGNQIAGLVHVHNVVDGLFRAATVKEAAGRAYNVADGSDVTWRQYFGDLAALVGARKPRSIPLWVARVAAFFCEWIWRFARLSGRPPLTYEALNLVGSNFRVPIDRARDELGYIPTVTYEEGLKQVAEYIENTK